MVHPFISSKRASIRFFKLMVNFVIIILIYFMMNIIFKVRFL